MTGLPAAFDTAVMSFQNRSAPTANSTGSPEALENSARDFEAFFLQQMLENVFAGIRTDGMFGGGDAEKIFRSLLLQEYGKAISDSGGVGIADAVTKELLSIQEGQ